jgi:hypothetical protein
MVTSLTKWQHLHLGTELKAVVWLLIQLLGKQQRHYLGRETLAQKFWHYWESKMSTSTHLGRESKTLNMSIANKQWGQSQNIWRFRGRGSLVKCDASSHWERGWKWDSKMCISQSDGWIGKFCFIHRDWCFLIWTACQEYSFCEEQDENLNLLENFLNIN